MFVKPSQLCQVMCKRVYGCRNKMKLYETMNPKLFCWVIKITYSLTKTKGIGFLRKVVKTNTQSKESVTYRKHESSTKVL